MTRYCIAEGCGKSSSFGFPDDKSATYCGIHGTPLGMINIKNKRCLHNECSKQAVFGLSTDKIPTRCGPHGKLLGMIDIKNKRCLYDECDKLSPTFGFPNDKVATYCGKHGALIGMIDIKNKKCLHDGCDKQPSFGLSTDKVATYCGKHGEILGMIDINHKKCLYDGCLTRANFGKPSDKTATYCGKHGEILGMVDIKNKKCLYDGCITRANFGNLDDKVATYCGMHGTPLGMIDIKNKKCKTCDSTRINSKYKPNCSRCHFYLNPDDPRIINYKTKEQAYMSALLEKFSQFKLDKTINGGCSKRRPDGFLDLLTHVIIIEIDENEHKSYDDTCNNRRTMELSQDVDHRPIVFIRLNPDSYKLNGIHMKGSFSLTKTGELKAVKKEFNKRLNSLIESVEIHMITIPDKTISVEYLYFTSNEI